MAKKKKASWVGPVNPADAETGVLKPAGELTGEALTESQRMSPRPVVVPKDKKVTTERKVKKVDPKTGATYEVAEHLREHKEPVQKRETPKRKPLVLGGQTVRAPKRGELKRGITVVATEPGPKKPKKVKKVAPKPTVERDAVTGRAKKAPPTPPPTPPTPSLTVVAPVAPKPERSRPTIAPGAGARREPVHIDVTAPEGNQASRKLKGFAVPHKVIAPAVNQALKHLDDMAATRGTPEHHSHLEAFNTIHPTILGMDTRIHQALGVMHNHVMHPKHNSSSVITQIKSAIGDRLSEGKKMETQRAQRQGRT